MSRKKKKKSSPQHCVWAPKESRPLGPGPQDALRLQRRRQGSGNARLVMSPSQSACLPPPPPPPPVQSVSELRRRYLMVFIYPFHVGFLMPCPPAPPLDVVLSTPRAFSLWAILGGFMVGPDLPLISFRSILKQETETGRLRPPPHSSPPPRYPSPAPLFIFISDCMCSDGSLAWKRKKKAER